jgi:hypothetical protein
VVARRRAIPIHIHWSLKDGGITSRGIDLIWRRGGERSYKQNLLLVDFLRLLFHIIQIA